MTPELKTIIDKAETNDAIGAAEGLWILQAGQQQLPGLLYAANMVRHRNFGNRVKLCSIINAKSGACSEDCTFCAQSAHHPEADTNRYDHLRPDVLLEGRQEASGQPILHFGIVTSGEALADRDIGQIEETLAQSESPGANWCASLGCLSVKQLQRLHRAGLKRFHHNIETARSFFPNVCTTHSYEERVQTVRNAKEAGMQVCCGGILGLGESLQQRVEMAETLAELEVDSIPLNFLVPIPGTSLEHLKPMLPLDILLCIVMFRLMCPTTDVRLAAGRSHLRRMQSMVFHAGCTGIMVGDLLTITGEDVEADLQMIRDLGLVPELPETRAHGIDET